jgi:heptosyltransferase-2
MGMAELRPLSAKRILVIQTAFLGDITLSSVFLSGLRLCFPQAKIYFLTTTIGAKLLQPNPWGITPIAYDKRGREKGVVGFFKKWRELEKFRPELTFCLHRSLRTALLARAAGGKIYGFSDAAGAFLYDVKISRAASMYEADKNNALLAAFAKERGVELPRFPKLFTTEAEVSEAASLLSGIGEFAVLAPSSVWATKRWPAERFAELGLELWRKHRLRSVIVGGNEIADLKAAEQLLKKYAAEAKPGEISPLDLSGKTGLGALKSVLSRARIVVANDSAPLHVAIAMGAPVVGVFGPTTRELGFFPLAPEGKAGVAELSGLDCRPCGLHGHHECPKKHFRCMLELTSSAVFAEVDKILCR